ncbi:MAG TPA: hypothetical protein VG847_16785 [Chitinophagaceae bacterium]|nr:hypothetical protein [Chitinophagaceae bacterium]
MKKIFTLLVMAAGTFSIASAQTGKHQSIAYNDSKKIDHHDASFGKTNGVAFSNGFFSSKIKENKLAAINREYDKKIALVKSNRHLSKKQKAWQIQLLQDQKKKEISKVEMQYAKGNDPDAHKW